MDMVQKLMVSGFVCSEGGCPLFVEVRRGMPILSREGQEVGKVAAVVLNSDDHQATHLLLSRLPEISGYWLIPVNLIAGVQDERVQLSIPDTAVESLTRWHAT